MAKEILVADPDKADQEEFKKIFELAGYRLVFSENGEETLLRIKLFKPDLIVAGTGLGEMSGFELCEAIKADPELRQIPVILLSNIFEEVSKKNYDRVRADGIISKPFREDEVLNLVDHLLEEEAMKAKSEFSLDGLDEMEEEEIIELLDVMEEPEQRMSINDFVAPVKEEPFQEIASLESWDKLEVEEKPFEKELTLVPEENDEEMEGMLLHLEKEVGLKEATPEDDLFGKIELEEILEKMEKLKPALEKEWPVEKEEVLEEEPLMIEEPAEKYVGLEAFKAALQKEVQGDAIGEAADEAMGKTLQPFRVEEPKAEAPPEIPATEITLEKELKELIEEEFPAELFEELGEEEIEVVEELQEERLEIFEEAKAPMILEEEVGLIEKPGEIRIDELEELGFPKAVFEEAGEKEIGVIEEPKEERIEIFEKAEAPRFPEEEIVLPLRGVEQQMGEVIAKGVQEMMENFITKIVPEMAQNIVTLTVDRIERMVREIVPDLAERAIQEEIKRLQKGEKD
jgi:CheY-like chemotaxis protein